MSKSKKRAAPADEGGSSKPKKQKKSPYQVDESLLNLDLEINEAFAVMDSQLLADYAAQKITRFGSDLSSIEVADLSLPGMFICLVVLLGSPTLTYHPPPKPPSCKTRRSNEDA